MSFWRIFSFGVALTILLSASLGWAADAVKVRGGAHEGFGRLVFEWRKPVGYSATISDEVLSVRFDRPFSARLDLAVAKLRDHVRGARISKDGRTAIFSLNGAYTVSSFRGKSSIIVDFRPGDTPAPVVRRKSRPELRVRVGEHPTYTRLVFDWKTRTRYTVETKDGVVTVSFAAPASINRVGLASRLPNSVALAGVSETDGGIMVSFKAPKDARTRHFVSQNRVVVDILRRQTDAQTSTKPPKATKTPRKAVPVKAKTGEIKAVSSPQKETVATTKNSIVAPPAIPAPQALASNSEKKDTAPDHAAPVAVKTTPKSLEAPKSLLPTPAKIKTATASQPSPAKKPTSHDALGSQGAASHASTQPAAVAATAEHGATNESLAQGGEKENAPGATSPVPAPSAVSGSTLSTAPDTVVKFRKSTDADKRKRRTGEAVVSLKFNWPEPVGAAIFQRAGYTWIVFDKRKPLDLAQMRQDGKGVVTKIEQLPISNASVIRVTTGPEFHPRAKQDGLNWIVEFVTGRTRPSVPIPVEPNPEAEGGPELFIPATEIGKIMVLPDPEVGDELQIATLRAPGQGIRGDRGYPEFRLLGSVQGVVLQALSDDVVLSRRPEGLVVSLPGGLYISDLAPDFSGKTGRAVEGRRLFKVLSWGRSSKDDFYEVRQELQSKGAAAPLLRREKARLDLARFYFARGFGPEAEGVLAAMASANTRLSSEPQFKALRGAVSGLRGQYRDAAEYLRDSRLDNYEEIELWRGLAAAGMKNWKNAHLYFKRGDGILVGYPPVLRIKLGLIRANTALQARDPGSADSWLQRIGKFKADMSRSQRAALEFLRARVAFVNRNLDRATELWSGLVDSRDLYYAAQSSLSLVNVGLLQETMPVEEAIKRLEVLRYRWRGDEIELQVLRRLGNLYLEKENYRKGLGVLRAAATYFPDDPGATAITQKMTKVFRDLYLGEKAKDFSPLSALALYDEFRELTPAGDEGNQVIQKLAERLVDVDLLSRAADLLLHQVKYRLKGDQRAEVGAKLAVIRLLDRDPERALKALRISDLSGLPEALENDRRRIKARALFEMGDTRQAIELLAGDISRNADLLRADIHWRTENWSQAANVLQRLSGEPPEAGEAFDQARAQIVLNWAVALQLSHDSDGLSLLRDIYGAAMERSPLSNVFEFISSADDEGKSLDIKTLTSRIAATEVFEAFMDDYRNRLLKNSDTDDKEEAEAPANTAPTSAAPSTTPTNG